MAVEPTVLSWTGPGVQPYSARGLTQTLELIDGAAQIRRSINAKLIDMSVATFQQYRSTISCTDVLAPAFDGIWPGQILTVDCAIELSYKTSGGAPTRDAVAGSSYTLGDYTFYRPQLTMMVTSGPSRTYDEYGSENGWQITLEETESTVTA